MRLFGSAQARDGQDRLALRQPREQQATIYDATIYLDRARAAIPFLAAVLHVGVAELAQRVQQRHIRRERDLMCATIDVECYDFQVHKRTTDNEGEGRNSSFRRPSSIPRQPACAHASISIRRT